MNAEQRKAAQIVILIVCCFGIYTYTAVFTQVIHYCDYTGLEIQERIGHEVTFEFHDGTRNYYCGVNVSLLAFQALKDSATIDTVENVLVRCTVWSYQ